MMRGFVQQKQKENVSALFVVLSFSKSVYQMVMRRKIFSSRLSVLIALSLFERVLSKLRPTKSRKCIYPKESFDFNEINKFAGKVVLPVSVLTAHCLPLFADVENRVLFGLFLINTKQS